MLLHLGVFSFIFLLKPPEIVHNCPFFLYIVSLYVKSIIPLKVFLNVLIKLFLYQRTLLLYKHIQTEGFIYSTWKSEGKYWIFSWEVEPSDGSVWKFFFSRSIIIFTKQNKRGEKQSNCWPAVLSVRHYGNITRSTVTM